MPKVEVPLTIFERHKILFKEGTSRDELIGIGVSYFEKEMLYDALEYFEKAQQKDSIEKIKALAIKEGDLLLYQNCMKALEMEPQKDDLLKLKENAIQMGKLSVSEQIDFLLPKGEKIK